METMLALFPPYLRPQPAITTTAGMRRALEHLFLPGYGIEGQFEQ
jgi:hypothetical protein